MSYFIIGKKCHIKYIEPASNLTDYSIKVSINLMALQHHVTQHWHAKHVRAVVSNMG